MYVIINKYIYNFLAFQIDNEGENKVNVADLLLELRQYRMGLIQTADQLFFSYQAIIEGMKLLNDPVIKSIAAWQPDFFYYYFFFCFLVLFVFLYTNINIWKKKKYRGKTS